MKKSIQKKTSIQTKIVTVIGGIVIIAMVLAGTVVVNLASKTVMRNKDK